MRSDTWYGQAMVSDKEKFQAWLEKTSADEIHEKLPHFGGKKKSVAIDELVARARDEELKPRSRKETAQWLGILCAVMLAVIALIYFTQL